MSTQLLLALDLLLVVTGAAAVPDRGLLSLCPSGRVRRGPDRRGACRCRAGLALCARRRVVVVVVLAGRGWWFAG